MIEFLITCGLVWIVLKIMLAVVSIPFAIVGSLLGAILEGPSSVIFWIALIFLIFMVFRRSDGTDRDNGAFRMRQLYRSETNRLLCGVCGGIADYFRVDAAIVRLIFAVLCILGGGSVLLVYLLAALIIPRESARY